MSVALAGLVKRMNAKAINPVKKRTVLNVFIRFWYLGLDGLLRARFTHIFPYLDTKTPGALAAPG